MSCTLTILQFLQNVAFQTAVLSAAASLAPPPLNVALLGFHLGFRLKPKAGTRTEGIRFKNFCLPEHFGILYCRIASYVALWHVSEVCNVIQLKIHYRLNPLECKGNCSATSNNTKLAHWLLMGGLLHLVQWGGDWSGLQLAKAPPRCTKCNSPPISTLCTSHFIGV